MDRNAPEGIYQVWRNYHSIIWYCMNFVWSHANIAATADYRIKYSMGDIGFNHPINFDSDANLFMRSDSGDSTNQHYAAGSNSVYNNYHENYHNTIWYCMVSFWSSDRNQSTVTFELIHGMIGYNWKVYDKRSNLADICWFGIYNDVALGDHAEYIQDKTEYYRNYHKTIWYCLQDSYTKDTNRTKALYYLDYGHVVINLPLNYVTDQWVYSIISEDMYHVLAAFTSYYGTGYAPDGDIQWINYYITQYGIVPHSGGLINTET